MFVWQSSSLGQVISTDSAVLYGVIYLPLALLFSFPVAKKLPKPKTALGEGIACAGYGVILVVCILCIISSSYNPFIYFRF
jgi:drug/metabolite transporter superfamily protein YnfA